MTLRAPDIDPRTSREVIEQLKKLLQVYAPEYHPDAKPDVGLALIKIFGRFSELIIERLNQVPQKQFLAFLDLLGASVLPPQPARVPLTFMLAGAIEGIVPAGTQVAAVPGEGETAPVIFETERDLLVTAAALSSIYTRQRDAGVYDDYSSLAAQSRAPGLTVFTGQTRIPHLFYIGHSSLFDYPKLREVRLGFTLKEPSGNPLDLQWQMWDGVTGTPLAPASDSTKGLSMTGEIVFNDLVQFPNVSVGNTVSAWVRCVLQQTLAGAQSEKLPTVAATLLTVKVDQAGLGTDGAFSNATQLDTSKDFFPFGEKPKFGDTFYLACNEAFAKSGARITISINLANPSNWSSVTPARVKPSISAAQASTDLQLQWECWNGADWLVLGTSKSTPDKSPSTITPTFTDESQGFTTAQNTRPSQVSFKLPDGMQTKVVNGVEGYWIRVRLVAGNYGGEPYFVAKAAPPPALYVQPKAGEYKPLAEQVLYVKTQDGKSFQPLDQTVYELVGKAYVKREEAEATGGYRLIVPEFAYAPPAISKITVAVNLDRTDKPDMVVTQNDFIDQPVLFLESGVKIDKSFDPFVRGSGEPTLFLGFDLPSGQSVGNRKLSIFFGLDVFTYDDQSPPQPGAAAGAPPQLTWKYWAGSSEWQPLSIFDDTNNFTVPGLVEFMPPSDFASREEFGLNKYWVRVALTSGAYAPPPRVHRVLLNTTIATQAVTFREEVLGSSNGSPNQVFQTAHAPILADPQLEVREFGVPDVNQPGGDGQAAGPPAVDSPGNPAERSQTAWVRWTQVMDFYGSGSSDRHYLIDNTTGEVRFGDGLSGMIPPIGGGNVRMALYRSGGGTAGNKPADTITQLKTTVPYIRSVNNFEPASGGADKELQESLLERVPRMLRNRNRAVTLEDYEDLAKVASPAVARSKCVPLINLKTQSGPNDPGSPGTVSLIIVPRSADPKPMPSLGLIEQVQTYIESEQSALTELVVVGPRYKQINIKASVALTSPEYFSALGGVISDTLSRYLHPLTGGPDGTGWGFGRAPHESHLYALIEGLVGVDYVKSLEILPTTPSGTYNLFLVYSGTHQIELSY